MIKMALKLLYFCCKIAQLLGAPPLGLPSKVIKYLVTEPVCDTLELHQFVQHGG